MRVSTAGVNERMKKTMAEKDLKRKFALWIRPSLLEEVDSLYKSDNCASRSEFHGKGPAVLHGVPSPARKIRTTWPTSSLPR